MADLSKEEVRHIAHLARIRLTDDEVTHFQEQLSSVIDYNIKLLSEVDTSGVEPTAQTTGLVNVWREDEDEPSLSTEDALSQATTTGDNQFVVPKVLGES